MGPSKDQEKYNTENLLFLAQLRTALKCLGSQKKPLEYVFKHVINQNFDINFRVPYDILVDKDDVIPSGYTPLHLAVLYGGKWPVVEFLLKNGADFTIQDEEGKTALHVAAEVINGNYRGVSFIDGYNFEAIGKETVEKLLEACIEAKYTENPTCKNGISHFHIACMVNAVQAVEFYLKAGVIVNQAVSKNSPCYPGYTPLHFAARYSCVETAEVLLKHGVYEDTADAEGFTPLMLIVQRHLQVLDVIRIALPTDRSSYIRLIARNKSMTILLTKAMTKNVINPVDIVQSSGLSAVHIASILNDQSMIRNFLEQNININNPVASDSPIYPGYTALHFAAHAGIRTMKLLLHNGANIFAKDANGFTPLDLCIDRHQAAETHSVLSTDMHLCDTLFSNGTTKLLDIILALNSYEDFETVSKDIADLALPLDSPIWKGYNILHIAVKAARDWRAMSSSYMPSSIYLQRESDLFIKIIGLSLKLGADPNIPAANGCTPIHLAFYLKKEGIVKLFLKNENLQALHNRSDNNNLSYLHIACASKDVEAAQRFLEQGAGVNELAKCNLSDILPNNEEVDIFELETEDDLNDFSLKPFEETKEKRQISRDEAIISPLHIAVLLRDKASVKLLLQHGADVHAKNAFGLTPIHYSLKEKMNRQDKSIANLLLSVDNLEDCVFEKLNFSHLHVAAALCNAEAVKKLILDGAVVDSCINFSKDNYPEKLSFLSEFDKCTPLHIATMKGCRDSVELLIEKGADIFRLNAKGKSPLLLAMDSIERDIIEKFFQNLDFEDHKIQEFFDGINVTKLHLACFRLDKESVSNLLENGAKVNSQINEDLKCEWAGFTPLHVLTHYEANRNGNTLLLEILNLLLDHEADMTIKDAKESTPVHHAGEAVDLVSSLIEKQKSYDFNPTDSRGLTHFHIACRLNKPGIVEKFLNCGKVDVNGRIKSFAKDLAGYSPLHYAIRYGWTLDAVEILLKNGADPNARDDEGNTPIHIVIKRSYVIRETTPMLSRYGADLQARNVACNTIVDELLSMHQLNAKYVYLLSRLGFNFNTINPSTNRGCIADIITAWRMHITYASRAIADSRTIAQLDENGMNAIQNSICTFSLTLLSPRDYPFIFENLMRRGCELNHQDNIGRTALHVAVKFNNYLAAAGLLQLGADINISDKEGRAPIEYCYQYAVRPTIKCLLIQIEKLSNAKLYVSDQNRIAYEELKKEHEIEISHDEIHSNAEVNKMLNTKFESELTLMDFLSEDIVFEYRKLQDSQRKKIDCYFKYDDSIRQKFRVNGSLLLLQYRKARKRYESLEARKQLLEPSVDSLIELGVDLPILCLESIMKYLSNDDLNNLIIAGEKKSDDHSETTDGS